MRLDLAPLLEASQAELKIDVPNSLLIRFSAKSLRSVVYNLLSNVLKYRAPERPARVQIRCATTSHYHVLTFTDNGLGIAANRIGQLFQMFKRFQTHVEGSGVGLYMVKKMVENGRGRFEVTSQVDIGSTFTVYFPR